MGESSNDGEKDDGFCFDPVVNSNGMCPLDGGDVESAWKTMVEVPGGGEGVDVAGLGAIGLCLTG